MQTAGARRLREYEQDSTSGTRPALRLLPERQARDVGYMGERRTVKITGQPSAVRSRRRAAPRQVAARPDRIALWAFLLSVVLVLLAAATAHAAIL